MNIVKSLVDLCASATTEKYEYKRLLKRNYRNVYGGNYNVRLTFQGGLTVHGFTYGLTVKTSTT